MKRLLVATLVLLTACDAGSPPPVVTVYAATELEEGLDARFADSDFQVVFVFGESRTLTDQIINKQDSPKADVLITPGVLDIWRAGDSGALRPIRGKSFARVPATLKDPEGAWAAIAYQHVTVVAAANTAGKQTLGFGDLGDSGLVSGLCLSSSQLPINQVLIGMLIADLGVKPAERVVRNWVRNLAQAPYASEADLIEALERGDCSHGIVSGPIPDGSQIERVMTTPTYLHIDGVGISRHAGHPEAAQAFVDWMLSDYQPDEMETSEMRNVGTAGWQANEARLLTERAGYW